MGAQESHLSDQSDQLRPLSSRGYHVLRVADSSPASEAGIEPFFDYIVGIGGQAITDDGEALTTWLDQSEGQVITLQVYSSRRREIRNIKALPNRNWSLNSYTNHSHGEHQPSLLGLSLRLCCPENALANVWHVLDIVEGSPAQDAGLVPFGDWIIGYAGGILRGENDFYEVVEEHEDRPLRLFVYSADYEVTREVVIVPNRSWGSGDGLLGCSIGFGLLHRIPKTTTKTTAPSYLIPNEVNDAYESNVDDEEREMLADFSKTSLMAMTDVTRTQAVNGKPFSLSSDRRNQNFENSEILNGNRVGQEIIPDQRRNHDYGGQKKVNSVIEEAEEENV
ncbi:GRASP55/65 PDZ-like domain-containing protein [Phakopsora pachyrhizi]|uniref:GRASP55/65 PDZ-like domain-domain-containing protein n=1 Tax=Phakopsora pachyrhizi TaxID=170000 RepID=A0AAV0B537_PHAPC|nr:GRASP55/65 PDZ-like domain-containing protein [Phakopsora pachyrhizi]KAI8446095.1 GRASP55/65 PDZ-like domain-containing protein [Phakopsora pachyrhizi]CAH7678499.1 GRASP55/65 PDZ-like domain-domain-containing protein [Phakopsora pachyrhizi]CAH7685020.1 GRASP55/65 PDZ-like domain-domain-containing protein [Phakopsora pachyrhizi]